MKNGIGKAKCYAVELCDGWKILSKIITIYVECQVFNLLL